MILSCFLTLWSIVNKLLSYFVESKQAPPCFDLLDLVFELGNILLLTLLFNFVRC